MSGTIRMVYQARLEEVYLPGPTCCKLHRTVSENTSGHTRVHLSCWDQAARSNEAGHSIHTHMYVRATALPVLPYLGPAKWVGAAVCGQGGGAPAGSCPSAPQSPIPAVGEGLVSPTHPIAAQGDSLRFCSQ